MRNDSWLARVFPERAVEAFRRCFLAPERPECRLEPMRSPLGIFLGALALLQLLGGHWALLQTGAWMGMVVQYSQQAGLKAGLAQAFDGEHPCPVCKAIQAGKKHEQKKAPLLRAELKKDYLAPWSRFQFHPGWVDLKFPGFDACLEAVAFEPAVPPPRRA
jgi:hypothetical protein